MHDFAARQWLDAGTKATLKKIPLLTVKASPRDKEKWVARLKEEYAALIHFVKINKETGNDWFQIASNKTGTRWTGKCWIVHNLLKYEFDLQFDVPAMYPDVPCELELPELDGKTAKMYRGGKICLDTHFKPLWAKNVPHFGIAHALALGLGPWLHAEIPHMIERGVVVHKEGQGKN